MCDICDHSITVREALQTTFALCAFLAAFKTTFVHRNHKGSIKPYYALCCSLESHSTPHLSWEIWSLSMPWTTFKPAVLSLKFFYVFIKLSVLTTTWLSRSLCLCSWNVGNKIWNTWTWAWDDRMTPCVDCTLSASSIWWCNDKTVVQKFDAMEEAQLPVTRLSLSQTL